MNIGFKTIAQISACAVTLCVVSGSAFAAVATLKQVQVTSGSQIDLLFDQKVQKSQIRTEFINDIIQLSLTDVAVYPAKISSVSGGELTKIFAYQYAPKLVRCRITVKGKAEDYKDRIQVSQSGKLVSFRLGEEGSGTAAVQASAKGAAPAQKGDAQQAKQAPPQIDQQEERALLERVMKAPEPEKAQAAVEKEKPAEKEKEKEKSARAPHDKSSDSIALGASSASKPIAGGKPLPSPFKAMGKLAAVLALFGVLALVAKRFMGKSGGSLSALGKFAKMGRKEKMIEVLQTHHLGPKKSIAVVRVAGRVLVLGVSAESINLITQLSPGSSADALDDVDLGDLGLDLDAPAKKPAAPAKSAGLGAMAGGPADFFDLLNQEKSKPMTGAVQPEPRSGRAQPQANRVSGYGAATQATQQAIPQHLQQQFAQQQQAQAQSAASVRTQIRNRLEGLKQL